MSPSGHLPRRPPSSDVRDPAQPDTSINRLVPATPPRASRTNLSALQVMVALTAVASVLITLVTFVKELGPEWYLIVQPPVILFLLVLHAPLVVITSCAVGQAIRRSTPSWVVALGILGLDQVVPWVSDLVRAGLDSSLSTDGITPVEWCELYQGCLMIACGVMAAFECARRCDPPAGVVLLAGFSAFIVTIAAYSMVSARIANSVSPAYDESDLRLPTVLRSGIQVQYSAAEPLDVMGAWLTTGLALVLGTVALRLITSPSSGLSSSPASSCASSCPSSCWPRRTWRPRPSGRRTRSSS